MRTMPRAILFVIALTLSFVTPTRIVGQAGNAEQDADSGGPSVFSQCTPAEAKRITTCVLGGAPVLNAPFSAEAVTTWHPPANSGRKELRAIARYYRDRAGHVRIDQMFVGNDVTPQRIVVTPDPTSWKAYVLDPVARTASETSRAGGAGRLGDGGLNTFVLPLSLSHFLQFPRSPMAGVYTNMFLNMTLEEQSLGQRSMAGVQVRGTRFTATFPPGAFGIRQGVQMTDEQWVSPDLELVVYNRGEDSVIGVIEYQLTAISRGEVPAELFEVPADYTVIDSWAVPGTWFDNPYPLLRDGKLNELLAKVDPNHK